MFIDITENIVQYAEFVISAIGLFAMIVVSWVHMRVEMAKVQQKILNIEKDILRIEKDQLEQRKSHAADLTTLWQEISDMKNILQDILVTLERKEDREKK